MDRSQQLFDQVCQHARQSAIFASIESLLHWDERVLLPAQGAEYRAEQIAAMSGLLHDRQTDKVYGERLAELAASPLAEGDTETAANIRELKRDFDKKVKLPKALVEELTRACVMGQHTWADARRKDDFAMFQPKLEHIIQLKQQEAEALGYEESPYDALLDDYEPGERTSNVARVLEGLRADLVPLVEEVAASKVKCPESALRGEFPTDAQDHFGRMVAAAIGFDFQRGRLDTTDHPFCSTMGPRDCRITTRYYEDYFGSALFSILHEAGHGLYEQGLRDEQFGLPLGEAVSLGIHESQSRMWENIVGRSHAFWQHFYPQLQQALPHQFSGTSLDEFYFAANNVEPSLIRIEADEATYNLHILVRFELEQDLITGNLKVADLPEAWHSKYRNYLGIQSPTDADGVMQDIHWSGGLVGYFATYSLGNLYAAQFFEQAEADLGNLSDQFAAGSFAPLLGWLREKIHHQGRRYPAAQLVERVTGKPLSHKPLLNYLRGKLAPLYGL